MPEPTASRRTAEPVVDVDERSEPTDPRHRGLAEAILDSVAEAVFVFDPDSHVIGAVNRGACDLFGRSSAALLGHRIEEFLLPEYVQRLTNPVAPLAAGERDTSTFILEHDLEGRSISVEIALQMVDLPGGTRGIVAIARDVGDRIEVQVRLQRLAQAEHARAAELDAVIRSMGEAVIVCQADGSISLTNPAGERLFGDVAGRTYDDILAQLHDPGGIAPQLGVAGGPVELAMRADPNQWVEIATYPINVEVGLSSTPQETIAVMRDVTEARRREAVRETFVGVLSHELRTPITMIFGGAQILARETSNLDEATKRSISRDIYIEAERLQRLVEDVLALNRFGDGPGEIGWEPVLLQRLVPNVVQSEQVRWPSVTFKLDIAPDLPTVTADQTYVEQVLRNLLTNAAKYGGPASTVTIKAESGDGEAIVRVLDDGPGFPADEAPRLFELFYRSPGTAATAGGAGIGLFVCARLVGAMGGRIWANPREEGGAEFGFALVELKE